MAGTGRRSIDLLQQLTNTHVKRWKEHRHEVGYGHLYQGRFKCFPVQTDDYFYDVVRYVERNALRANLVAQAELWPWSSLGRGLRTGPVAPILAEWPLSRQRSSTDRRAIPKSRHYGTA